MSLRPGSNAALCVLLAHREIKLLLQVESLGGITDEPLDRLHEEVVG
ncbi:MAG: hypothetical protein OXH92_04930 [Bryobacterales bacterium]|nr:hypothetical protein [Bryobacterales bacterium]MDE0295218.1 hypothetical protein [Bryobacterales bacterium]MDE0433330.1 hypothetical protein [Bryobacterales bacterium]